MKLAVLVGKFALFLAGMAFLTAASFFVLGAYLASWPIMRISPRNRKMTSLIGLAVSAMAVARAYGIENMLDGKGDTEDTEDTENPFTPEQSYPFVDGPVTVLGPECFIANDGSVLCWRGEDFIPKNLDSAARKVEGGE
jgi:hypothetical protein